MLADIQCQTTAIPSSTEHTVCLKVDAAFYDEFFHRTIAGRRISSSEKATSYLGVDAELHQKKVRGRA